MIFDQPQGQQQGSSAHAQVLSQFNLGLEPELRFATLRLDMNVKTRLLA